MNWINYFSKIYVLNLRKRVDRLLEVTTEMEQYNIPFELVTSIEDEENGARGLRDTMVNIFNDAIENKYEQILVFEDDALFLIDPNPIMNEVVKQLPYKWDMIFLGCQATSGFKYRHSANLLQLDMAFATHAVCYSLEGMKEIMTMGLDYPIDNSIVLKVQPLQRSYAIQPMLCTQRESFSDIGRTVISWRPFLEGRFNQKIAEQGL